MRLQDNRVRIRVFVGLAIFLLLQGCASTAPSVEGTSKNPTYRYGLLQCFWNKPTNYPASIAYAKEYYPYAIAATWSYKNAAKLFAEPPGEKWRKLFPIIDGKRVLSVNNWIGFAAKAWERTTRDGKREIIISYRGTDGFLIKDFLFGNLVFINIPILKNQFELAERFAENVLQGNQEITANVKIVFVGHSLGGGLAQYVQRLHNNSTSITFDPSPNTGGGLYSLFREQQPTSALRLFERGEVLMPLRWIISRTEVVPGAEDVNLPIKGRQSRRFDFQRGNFITQHSVKDLTMNMLKLSALHGDPSALSILNGLKTPPENDYSSCRPDDGEKTADDLLKLVPRGS